MDEKTILQKRKQAIISALCKHVSLDPQKVSVESVEANDVKGLISTILKASGEEATLASNEVLNWVAFADTFPLNSDGCNEFLTKLNEDLTLKSVLLGDGFKPSVADIVVFSSLHSFVSGLSATDKKKIPNVLRWMDYILNKKDLGSIFESIPVEKIMFMGQTSKDIGKVESDVKSKKNVQEPVTDSKKNDKLEADPKSEKSDKVEADSNSKKSDTKKKVKGDGKVTEEKKKAPEKDSAEKDLEVSVSLLNIQVGLIRKAWKHPSADSLLVEEIDLGDAGIRQVVSGLAKYCSPEELIVKPPGGFNYECEAWKATRCFIFWTGALCF
ncbi:hypothetical protein AQUCO_00400512v1 [Aquilegia coerulea]|uniref:tRNA-binding domain-containing protein n=1 Tax=Aquilegia coerulea TaxID=218851 RepID=A0A2G5EVB9_AQUCA|nr:hypothetical protein AQUCO_00400512v1 [Aquilegia coerulea]